MTLNDWVNNPAGKNSAVMTNRQMYRDLYTSKFNKVMLREGNKFTYKCYKSKSGAQFVLYIKVPSEVIPKFYYDVVISFETKNPAMVNNPSLIQYDVQFYTNSPDFVFTHCHAYNKADLFFKPLAKKMSKLSLTQKAVERNPNDEVGYVKSIFFAYCIIKSRGLLQKLNYTDPYIEKNLVNEIRHADDVVAARQEAEAKMKAEARRAKRLEDAQTRERNGSINRSLKGKPSSTAIKTTPNIRTTKTAKRSPYSKTSKRI